MSQPSAYAPGAFCKGCGCPRQSDRMCRVRRCPLFMKTIEPDVRRGKRRKLNSADRRLLVRKELKGWGMLPI